MIKNNIGGSLNVKNNTKISSNCMVYFNDSNDNNFQNSKLILNVGI